MNQLYIEHTYFSKPDTITVRHNGLPIYNGPANVNVVDFRPVDGENVITVTLDSKHEGNFFYNSNTGSVEKDSWVKMSNLVVQNSHFRSLMIKCGLVEIDLEKNITFPNKYIDHENVLTMEGSIYLIKFEYPVKNWMHIHLHGRNLATLPDVSKKIKEKLLEMRGLK